MLKEKLDNWIEKADLGKWLRKAFIFGSTYEARWKASVVSKLGGQVFERFAETCFSNQWSMLQKVKIAKGNPDFPKIKKIFLKIMPGAAKTN